MYKRMLGWMAASFLFLTAILFLGKQLYDNNLENQAFARHAQSVDTSRILIHEHILRAVQDIHQLSVISCVKGYVEQNTPKTLGRIQQTLVASSDIYGRYDQIRIIDLEGHEKVRP